MEPSDHRHLYKKSKTSLANIVSATKECIKTVQTSNRASLVLWKRLKIDNFQEADDELSTEEELEKVKNATDLLKKGRKLEALKILRRCFARDPRCTAYFFRIRGYKSLRGCLSAPNPEVVQAAVWCIINLAAGSFRSATKMMRYSSHLVLFLQGSDPPLQELSAWALGNFAGDSTKYREILMNQGCIPHLINLISSPLHLTKEARTQSVLFALVNFARDENYVYIKHMLECSILDNLDMMLRTIDASHDVCLELGWLIDYICCRKEAYRNHAVQYETILKSLIFKLSQVFKLENKTQRDKVILPYLHSVGNIVGLSPKLALVACECPLFFPALFGCLTSDTDFIHKEALWILVNCFAEASCRALIMLQPKFLNLVFGLCQAADEDTVLIALYLLEATAKVSGYMCRYLVEQDTITEIMKVLPNARRLISEAALNLLSSLVFGLQCPRNMGPSVRRDLNKYRSSAFPLAVHQEKRTLEDVCTKLQQLQVATPSGSSSGIRDKVDQIISTITESLSSPQLTSPTDIY